MTVRNERTELESSGSVFYVFGALVVYQFELGRKNGARREFLELLKTTVDQTGELAVSLKLNPLKQLVNRIRRRFGSRSFPGGSLHSFIADVDGPCLVLRPSRIPFDCARRR